MKYLIAFAIGIIVVISLTDNSKDNVVTDTSSEETEMVIAEKTDDTVVATNYETANVQQQPVIIDALPIETYEVSFYEGDQKRNLTSEDVNNVLAEIRMIRSLRSGEVTEEQIDKVVHFLSIPSNDIRVLALDVLQHYGQAEDFDAVFNVKTGNDTLLIRGKAHTLGKIAGRSASTPEVKEKAFLALKDMFSSLSQSNTEERDGHLYTVVEGMGFVDSEKSIAFLLNIVGSKDHDYVMRSLAIRVLAPAATQAAIKTAYADIHNSVSQLGTPTDEDEAFALDDFKALLEKYKM